MELVRYCPQCSSIGEPPATALTCCPEHAECYVTPDIAKQAAKGFHVSWYPIITAPKDGTWFLVINGDGKMWTCNHPDNHMRGQWHKSKLYKAEKWVGHIDTGGDNPTHWMPLPEAPCA